MTLRVSRRLALFLAICLTLVLTVATVSLTLASLSSEPRQGTGSGRPASGSPASSGSAIPAATGASGAAAVASGAAAVASATSSATGRPPIDPPLPAFVGSIGDSIAVGFDATPSFGPQPGHAWSLGTDKGDGVFSLLERFRALGDDPATFDAAKAGARMSAAVDQAAAIVGAAARLAPGKSAFVTIELGGNDACAATPVAQFDQELRAAMAVLIGGEGSASAGLPAGSRLLVLSVPNIVRLRELTAGVADAQNVYRTFGVCGAYLSPSASAAALSAGGARIEAYNEVLRRACDDVAATYGKTGRFFCRSDQDPTSAASMYAAPFTLPDVSTLDYFHPSLSGQAKIAEGAWQAAYWAAARLPAVTDAVAGQGGIAAG